MGRTVVDLAETYCRIPGTHALLRGLQGLRYLDSMEPEAYEDAAFRAMLGFIGLPERSFRWNRALVTMSGSATIKAVFTAVLDQTRLQLAKYWPNGQVALMAPKMLTSLPGIPYPFKFAADVGYRNVIAIDRDRETLKLDVDDFCAQIRDIHPDAVYLESPSNILGVTLTADELRRLGRACSEAHAVLIIDHCFARLDHGGKPVPLAADVLEKSWPGGNWVMLFDTGKSLFTTRGEKLGFAIFGTETLAKIAREVHRLEHYEPNTEMMKRVTATMIGSHPKLTDYVGEVNRTIRNNVRRFAKSPLAEHLPFVPTAGSTLIIPLDPYKSEITSGPAATAIAADFVQFLDKLVGVQVTNGSGYYQPSNAMSRSLLGNVTSSRKAGPCLRIAAGRPEPVFEEGIERLEDTLTGKDGWLEDIRRDRFEFRVPDHLSDQTQRRSFARPWALG